jgi:hypothetical protein
VQSDLLHVVTAISNPIRWKSRNRLYKEFEAHMLDSGVRLTTVECAYGDIPHALDCAPEVNHVQVYGKTQLWIKENLSTSASSAYRAIGNMPRGSTPTFSSARRNGLPRPSTLYSITTLCSRGSIATTSARTTST